MVVRQDEGCLGQFSSPANQANTDLAEDPDGLRKFNTYWHNNMQRWTEQAIVGNPWSNINDSGRLAYFNPRANDQYSKITNDSLSIVDWNAFPRRLRMFFNGPATPPAYKLCDCQIYELADTGAIDGGKKRISDLQVPRTVCPDIDWKGKLTSYTPAGPRGWQDEYCEWSVQRDEDGQIRKVIFTCETPAYWFTLWKVNPDRVLQLYQRYISPQVQLEDLYLRDSHNNPVCDPLTGSYAYDPTNKWNRGPVMDMCGGAMHLTSGPNTLSAEIYLAAAATLARQCGNEYDDALICCAKYGQTNRNSDPHIGRSVNQAVCNGNIITLIDPVGLYIQQPNFAAWQIPGGIAPQSLWNVTRGHLRTGTGKNIDRILQAVFTVPDGMKACNICIGGADRKWRSLQWAGQIAETFNVALLVGVLPTSAEQEPLGCVKPKVRSKYAWPVQLLPATLAEAGSPIDLSPDVPQGSSIKMMIVVQGVSPFLDSPSLSFYPPDGLSVTDLKLLPLESSAPGQTSGGDTQTYSFTLHVAPNAPLGDRDVLVTRGSSIDKLPVIGLPYIPSLPGMLSVVPA